MTENKIISIVTKALKKKVNMKSNVNNTEEWDSLGQLSILSALEKATKGKASKIDLTEVQVQVGDNHTNKIELTDDMGIIMKYPSINSFTDIGVTEVNADNMLDIITSCILQIYEKKGEVIYDAKDSTRKELNDFVEQCNAQQFKEIQSFFDTMPRLKHTVKVKNPKTKVESDIELNGLNDFFA